MKTEMLMEAIENIDDSYIEEFAYGRKRFAKAPWGMIASAACLCLVIVAAIFLHNAGWMPYFNGTSGATNPSAQTIPSQTTRPKAEPEELDAVRALFSNKNGWYYRALIDMFASPKSLHLRYYFHNTSEFGEGLQPTKEELNGLMALQPDGGTPSLVILPTSKMDPILKETFGITVEEMDGTAFAGMYYAESIDSWCFWKTGELNVTNISIQDVEKETEDSYRMVYTAGEEIYEMILKRSGDGYHILSNMNISPQADNTRPSIEELFLQKGSWHNNLLSTYFNGISDLWGNSVFCRTYDGKQVTLTDFEKEALEEAGLKGDVWRMTESQLNEISFSCLNVPWNTLDWLSSGSGFGAQYPVYLEETGYWYGPVSDNPDGKAESVKIEECANGTVNFYYTYTTMDDGVVKEQKKLAVLQPHETGYYILSVREYDQEKIELMGELESLFGDYNSWYNRALVCEYTWPGELSLLKFFYRGFADEPQQPTDAEWVQLKDQYGFDENYDLFRLPAGKMNDVLKEYFGIELKDLEPECFEGLVYLESTNCYYFMATGALLAENVTVLSAETMEDGTISMEYTCLPRDGFVHKMMLRSNGDGYRILSNEITEKISVK